MTQPQKKLKKQVTDRQVGQAHMAFGPICAALRDGFTEMQDLSAMTRREIRYLVDIYYQLQDYRIATGNQDFSMQDEPSQNYVVWNMVFHALESEAKRQLEAWVKQGPPATLWAYDRIGIGPVLAAGITAFTDVSIATTVSKLWRIAGLDPTVSWLGKEKGSAMVKEVLSGQKKGRGRDWDAAFAALAVRTNRKAESLRASAMRFGDGKVTQESVEKAAALRPWNRQFKVLCWKCGESFWKVHNKGSWYGMYASARKQEYIEKNLDGGFHDLAEQTLASGKGVSSQNKATYKMGMLPDGRIHAMAKRRAVKLFLSHFWVMAYRDHYKKDPPLPWIIEHGGHTDIVMPEDVAAFEQEYRNAESKKVQRKAKTAAGQRRQERSGRKGSRK